MDNSSDGRSAVQTFVGSHHVPPTFRETFEFLVQRPDHEPAPGGAPAGFAVVTEGCLSLLTRFLIVHPRGPILLVYVFSVTHRPTQEILELHPRDRRNV